MKYILFIFILCITNFFVSAEEKCEFPNSVEDLLSLRKYEKMDTDSVYYYLRQYQDDRGNYRFFKLYEGVFNNTPILIYMMHNSDIHIIYGCLNPYTERYPSTLLLWRQNSNGITDWFKIKDGIIYTYKLFRIWDLYYIAEQSFKIANSIFTHLSSKETGVLAAD